MARVAFLTLGCKVNQYDTQAIREQFQAAGYDEAAFADHADVYVINTCTVTGTGDSKSRKAIRQAAARNPQASIIVCGCMAQNEPQSLRLPGVRLILGTQRRADALSLLEKALASGETLIATAALEGAAYEELSVNAFEGHTRAVIKIQEGCDRRCAYCIIPTVRGPVRSRPLDSVAREAAVLAEKGYREIVLTGIHLASYGRDLSSATLIDAMRAACRPEGVLRVRLGSLEPGCVNDDFISALRDLPKVCRHFHLSLQSGSDGVLRRMRRAYSAEGYLRAVDMLREAFPDVAFTTDVMVGFPGETIAEHEESLRFVALCRFSRLHVFPYSARPGTVAADMPGQVTNAEKQRRAREMSDLGARLEAEWLKALVGTSQRVLIEDVESGFGEGYTEGYARLRLPSAVSGEFIQASVTSVAEGGVLTGIRL